VKFIICEDNKETRENIATIINKKLMKSNCNYEIFKFDDYTSKMKNVIDNSSGPKVYILDIELPTSSGLDIARHIRKNDWSSQIIIVTNHHILINEILRSKLAILDFITKYLGYENYLNNTLDIVLEILDKSPSLKFEYDKVAYSIDFKDVTYIEKEPNKNKCIIHTKDKKSYPISKSLDAIMNMLDERFIQTHQSYIINLRSVESIDYGACLVFFKNGEKGYLLSRNYKVSLRSAYECN